MKLVSRTFLVAPLLALAALAQPLSAAAAPLVTTQQGPVRGIVSEGVSEFLGIPYAVPPVGVLRWQPPRPAGPWSGTLDATAFGKTCAQITTLGVFAGPANANEDCLFLNVFSPAVSPSAAAPKAVAAKLPVIVWIHGGGLVDGESNDYDARKLATTGPTVVVTINYRLGLFGYFAHPALDTNLRPFGNYGLMDQQLALRWVRSNIAAFGGDPANVTLGGQSAGSTSTAAAVLSPASAGLFHRAIFESGPLLTVAPLALAEQRGTAFATAAGCPGKSQAVAACLRALSPMQILSLQGTESANGPYVNGLMLDGRILTESPDYAFRAGDFNRMPIMNGIVADEANFGIGITQYFSPTHAPLTLAQYVANVTAAYSGNAGPGGGPPAYPTGTVAAILAQYPAANYPSPTLAFDALGTDATACRARHLNRLLTYQVPVYAYEFDYRSAPYYFPAMPGFAPLAAHTIDIQFLFPLYHGGPLGTPHALNPQEQHLSDQLTRAWTSFAKSGNPNGSGSQFWPRFGTGARGDYLSENVPALSAFSDGQYAALHHCGLWDDVLIY